MLSAHRAACAVAVGLVWLAARASAQEAAASPPAEAHERYERGEALFAEGNYEAALTELQRAYDIFGEDPARALLLYDIGRCYEGAFQYERALRYYQRYLDAGIGDAEGRAEVEERMRSLGERLATVRVDSNVPEIDVWLDGRPIGRAPGDLLVPAGEHVLEARAPGYQPARREVQLPAQTTVDVRLELERAEGLSGLHPAIAISAAGAAALAIAIGAGFGVDALSTHASLARRLASDPERWSVTQSEIDRVGGLSTVADVMFATGAVIGATAIVLFLFTDWDGAPPTERLSLAPRLGPDVVGLWAEGAL